MSSVLVYLGLMPTEGNKVGRWNIGFGSNMNVKNVREKKLVKVLGKYSTRSLDKILKIPALCHQ